MNFFKYDPKTKLYSFDYLSHDEYILLSDLCRMLYKKQMVVWQTADPDDKTYLMLMGMAKATLEAL